MRMLFAALGLAAVFSQTAVAAPRPETLYTSPSGPIGAFAQDGTLLAWFAPAKHGCNSVWVLNPDDGVQVKLPEQGPNAVNVTCSWPVVQPVRLALDFKSSTVLWTLRERSPLRFDYLLGARFVGDRLERRFQEIAHAARGAGLWLGGIAGDDGTLVYSVTSVDFTDEVTCLSKPKAPHACALRVGDGGGVYRVASRSKVVRLPGTKSGAIEIAAAHDRVAYVPAGSVGTDGRPLGAAQIDVRDATNGKLVGQVIPHGTPVALAVSATVLAALERTSKGLHLTWYDAATGRRSASIPVPAATSLELSANARDVVYRVGRAIHAVGVASHKDRVVAHAGGEPIGLSLRGKRLAWAENVGGVGRIRALELRSG